VTIDLAAFASRRTLAAPPEISTVAMGVPGAGLLMTAWAWANNGSAPNIAATRGVNRAARAVCGLSLAGRKANDRAMRILKINLLFLRARAYDCRCASMRPTRRRIR
jgi:hypothetical protein